MFAVTAILSSIIKIRRLFKSTKWRHFENVKFEAPSAQRVIKKEDKNTTFPEVEVTIDDSLGFSISVYGWPLPSTHQIYKDNFRSVWYTTVSLLLNQISSYKICERVSNDNGSCLKHTILKKNIPFTCGGSDTDSDDDSMQNPFIDCKEYKRDPYCQVLEEDGGGCEECQDAQKIIERLNAKRATKLKTPAKPKAPVSSTHPTRIKLALQEQCLKVKQLEEQLIEMREELYKSSTVVDDSLDKDILTIMSEQGREMTPFIQLFWQEQKKGI